MKLRMVNIKLISVLVVMLTLLNCLGTVGLANQSTGFSCDFDNDTQNLSIYGYINDVNSKDKEVTIEILQQSKTVTDIGNADFSMLDKVLYYTKQITADPNGYFTVSFTMDAQTGTYLTRVLYNELTNPIEKSFVCTNSNDLKNAVNAVNAVEANDPNCIQKMQKIISDNLNILSLKSPLYDILTNENVDLSKAYKALVDAPEFTNTIEINDLFSKELSIVAFSKLKNNTKALLDCLIKYNSLLGISPSDLYNDFTINFSEEKKLNVIDSMKGGNYSSVTDVKNAFCKNSVLVSFLNTPVWTDMYPKIVKYYNDYNATFEVLKTLKLSDFSALAGEKQHNVIQAIQNDSINMLDAFVAKFNSETVNQANTNNNNDNSPRSRASGSVTKIKADTALSTITPPPPMNTFIDLGNVEWARESIQALASKGIVSGRSTDTGIFVPDANVLREEFIKMVISGFGFLDEGAECTFGDVPSDQWYYKYVASAKKLGIINGDTNGNFGVGKEITREEMAAIVDRVVKQQNITLPDKNDKIDFIDSGLFNIYAKDAIERLQKSGVINGMDDGSFAPQRGSTRAEAAKVIYQIIKAANMI